MSEKRNIKLTYGDGNLQTQQGRTHEGIRCLCITKHGKGVPIGSVPTEYARKVEESDIDVILEFKSIESARTLQDELGELIAIWSREQGRDLFKESEETR